MRRLDHQIVSYFGEPSLSVWESDLHYAATFKDQDAIRIDVMRKDGSGDMTWDELQRIKDECGFPNYDAIEFYPSIDNIINNGPRRHLYVLAHKHPLIRRGDRHG